ncbi:MAG: mechanosensitive ion channel family protein [Bacteroidia bacterium]|nr:mechanosensitive ion channel family protein [Bacteroidia bacterium]
METHWLDRTVFENRVEDLLWFGGIILAGLLLKRFVSNHLSGLIYRFIKRYAAGVDVRELKDLLRKPVGLFILLLSIYIACKQIHYPESWQLPSEENFGLRFIIWKFFQISLIISLTWILTRLIDFFGIVLLHRARLTTSKADDQLVPFFKESIKFFAVILSFFISLGIVFHVNVASLIAGLGIGGIAIALAAKDTLENLLGSFTIFLDKPFTLGDLVKAGNVHGKVEKIGFRSTQIRTLEKTLVTVPNKKMIDAELENVSMRNMIRALFPITLRFETPIAKIERFKAEIMQYLRQHPDVAGDPAPAVRMDKITETGIELQFFFFINTTDMDIFASKREEILFKILRIAQESDLRFDTRMQELVIQK